MKNLALSFLFLWSVAGLANRAVEIRDSWLDCRRDDDCIWVEANCDRCCGRRAIRATEKTKFQKVFGDLCAGYNGSVCDCAPADESPRCVQGKCKMVPNRK